MKKILLSVGGAFFILLVIGTILYSRHLTNLKEIVEQKLQDMKQQGIPTSLAGIQKAYDSPKLIENAADMLKNIDSLYQECPYSPELYEDLLILGTADFPDPSEKLSQKQLESIKTMLENSQDFLDLFRKSMSIANCRFPIEITKGFSALLPHLSPIMNASRLFSLESLLAIENNQVEQAISSLILSFRCADLIQNEPFLISQLIYISCWAKNNHVFARLLTQCELSEQQLQRLTSILKVDRKNKLRDAYYTEICAVIDIFNKWDKDNLGYNSSMGDIESIPYWDRKIYQLSGTLYRDINFYITTMLHVAKNVEFPHTEWVKIHQNCLTKTDIYQNAHQNSYILSALLIPSTQSIWTIELEMMCHIQNYRTAFAIEHFRNKYKIQPNKLDELVPEFLEQIPLDFFTDSPTPIRYLKKEKGYVLYSIGCNQLDEQGNNKRENSEIPDISFSVGK